MAMKILLSGATGAIGRLIESLAGEDPGLEITGRAHHSEFFGSEDPGDVVVDFSSPELCARCLDYAVARELPLVIGTTGLDADFEARIQAAARTIPICQAANFSLGVNLLLELAARAAGALGEAFDIEIQDVHHRRKVDAPSGTALALGRAVATARGLDVTGSAIFDRSQTRQPRQSSEIGYQAIRGGDVAGEHSVFFLGDGERLELTHRATDRRIFARGAICAARWLADQPPGQYGMNDLLRTVERASAGGAQGAGLKPA